MEIEIKNIKDIIKILDFIIQTGVIYNPYTAYKILSQKKDITLLCTASSWSALGASINESAQPVIVPLPVIEINVVNNKKTINALKLSDKEKKLIITGELQCEETIVYCDFIMFDIVDTDYPTSEMDGLFPEFDFMDVSKEHILLTLITYLTKCGIDIIEKPLATYGLEPFADVKNNVLYVEEKTPEIILDTFISFLCEKTSSQSNEISKLENLMTIYILSHTLSFSIDLSQHTRLKAQLERCLESDINLNLSDSITRAFSMANFTTNFLKAEYELIYEEKEGKAFEIPKQYNKSVFNNIKESD